MKYGTRSNGDFGALKQEYIDEFVEFGVVVIPEILTTEEIACTRRAFHQDLLRYGVDHNDLRTTGANLRSLSSTGGAGGILDLFYPNWRLQIAEHDRIFATITELWRHTYAAQHPDFSHPFGEFDARQGFLYMNRVCYRVPDELARLHGKKASRPLQRSLTPHIDCCPLDMYNSGKEYPRWRPIQCITVLTDNIEENTGGFEAVLGFHKEFDSYFKHQRFDADKSNAEPPVCIGDFSPLRMKEDGDLIARYRHVVARAGSVIYFDWRIPHANSYYHRGAYPREAIYTGFLPNVSINQRFAAEQLRRYRGRLLPTDHWQKCQSREQYSEHEFTELGKRLMGIIPWNA